MRVEVIYLIPFIHTVLTHHIACQSWIRLFGPEIPIIIDDLRDGHSVGQLEIVVVPVELAVIIVLGIPVLLVITLIDPPSVIVHRGS